MQRAVQNAPGKRVISHLTGWTGQRRGWGPRWAWLSRVRCCLDQAEGADHHVSFTVLGLVPVSRSVVWGQPGMSTPQAGVC